MATAAASTAAPRVVSLLPSATDVLISLKLGCLLVGRSHECDWPEVQPLQICTQSKLGQLSSGEIDLAMRTATAALAEAAFMGHQQLYPLLQYGLGVYQTNLEMLTQLRPEVILTQLQDGNATVPSSLINSALHMILGYTPQVVSLTAMDMEGVWKDIGLVASAVGAREEGEELVSALQARLSAASLACSGRPRWKVACIVWPDPWYAAMSWVPQMLGMAGAEDVIGEVDRAVNFTPQQLAQAAPDVVLFALCGFDIPESVGRAQSALAGIKEQWQNLPAVRQGRVAVVDGIKLFSRPGPWLVESMEALVEILHPEAQGYGHQGRLWTLMPAL